MTESSDLRRARERLAKAEANLRAQDALADLEEGIALLDHAIACAPAAQQTVARNLASTYAARIVASIEELVDGDRGLPEPEMEHLFRLLLAFDELDIAPPANARALKLRLARRLIDRYYEGHAPLDKQKALGALSKIAGGRKERSAKKQ